MIFVFPEEFTGESVNSKCQRILDIIAKDGANSILISALDEIAWCTNLRGSDVSFNPVFTSYLFFSGNETILFIDKDNLTKEVNDYLLENNIFTASYEKVGEFMSNLSEEYSILIDPAKVNKYIESNVSPKAKIIYATSPVDMLKSLKNEKEIEGFRSVMVKDGVALVKFYRWLEENIPTGKVTELLISEKLADFRGEQELNAGPSFGTIDCYKEHGAICHYNATPESNLTIGNDGFLLIDSGGQYFEGTTDITRTIILGTPSKEEKHNFTLVLKGHIDLSMAVFPEGTRGDQIDVLARQHLWNSNLNYLHGTGHGIGHYLNVHEGPHSIRNQHNPVTLQPGMITSNEPGLYLAGRYGIRHENLTLIVEAGEGEYGKFYKFETLTLYPFDLNGIEVEILSPEEKQWLNDYHKKVFEKLSPKLNEDEKAWLAEKTKSI